MFVKMGLYANDVALDYQVFTRYDTQRFDIGYEDEFLLIYWRGHNIVLKPGESLVIKNDNQPDTSPG